MKAKRIVLSFVLTAALGAALFLISGPVQMSGVDAAHQVSLAATADRTSPGGSVGPSPFAAARPQEPPVQNPTAQQPFAVIKVAPFAYCCLTHQGPYSDIQQVIQALVSETQTQNIHPTGPLMAVYYNSPDQAPPEELLWEVGFPVTAQAMPEAPLAKKVWEYKTVARTFHIGPYERTGETIGRLMQWISEKGYTADGPILERYLDLNPNTVDPEKLRTEIWVPVKAQ